MSKAVVCYSGGHSSALCAIAAVEKYGADNVILLNHDITPTVEDQDIKRFKQEVADYLGLAITYANHKDWSTATPVQVCLDSQGWKFKSGHVLCTSELKTKPFKRWMAANDPNYEYVYIYGFDNTPKERVRANRRAQIMGLDGYKTEYPLIQWDIVIKDTTSIGIAKPMAYEFFKHANCIGCLKAGWQHWFIVFCTRPDIWAEAKTAEEKLGYAIHKNDDGPVYLADKEQLFADMQKAGVLPTEHRPPGEFWAEAKQWVIASNAAIPIEQLDMFAQHDQGVCLDCSA